MLAGKCILDNLIWEKPLATIQNSGVQGGDLSSRIATKSAIL